MPKVVIKIIPSPPFPFPFLEDIDAPLPDGYLQFTAIPPVWLGGGGGGASLSMQKQVGEAGHCADILLFVPLDTAECRQNELSSETEMENAECLHSTSKRGERHACSIVSSPNSAETGMSARQRSRMEHTVRCMSSTVLLTHLIASGKVAPPPDLQA